MACRSGRVDPDGYCENCGHAQPRERDHMEQELDTVAAVSDRGLRHHRNEDSFAVSSTALPDGSHVVAIVCDGVSSASRPDEASAAAATAANEALLASLPRGTHPQQAMHEAIVAASEAVNALAQELRGDGARRPPPPERPGLHPGRRGRGGRSADRRLGRRQPRLLGARGPDPAHRPAHRGRFVGRADGGG